MSTPWREPYRGSRYSFSKDGIFYRIPMSNYKIMAADYNSKILDALLNIKPNGGSFRITETREVITKKPIGGKWISEKICDYDNSIIFKFVDLNPDKTLRSGDIWPGFYYKHGASFSLSFYDAIFIHLPFGNRCWINNSDMELIQKLRVFLPKGGKFYINENGHVWTNTGSILDEKRMEEQVRTFSSRQKTLLNQRLDSTGLYPVYVCKWDKRLDLDLEDLDPILVVSGSDGYD